MTTTIWMVVLLAALLHACWNALVKTGEDRMLAMLLVAMGCTVLATFTLPFVAMPSAESWKWIVLSLIIHLAYKLSLVQAYKYGDFGHVYPIARGMGPLVAAFLAAIFIGEIPSGFQLIAMGLITFGITCLVLRGGKGFLQDLRPVGFAVLTGLCIASYTVVDGIGGRASDAIAYVCWLMALDGIPMLITAIYWRGAGPVMAVMRNKWHIALMGGGASFGAYGIVIWAMSHAPIAPVASLRETSVIFAALISAFILREGFGPWRIIATILVAIGAILMRM